MPVNTEKECTSFPKAVEQSMREAPGSTERQLSEAIVMGRSGRTVRTGSRCKRRIGRGEERLKFGAGEDLPRPIITTAQDFFAN